MRGDPLAEDGGVAVTDWLSEDPSGKWPTPVPVPARGWGVTSSRARGAQQLSLSATSLSRRAQQLLAEVSRERGELQGERGELRSRLVRLELERAQLEMQSQQLRESNQQLDLSACRLSTQCEVCSPTLSLPLPATP